jgi:Putative Ig domain
MRKALFLAALLAFFALPALAQDCSTLTILTESIPEATVGEPYNVQIEAIGGTGPYHFTVFDGELPEGLHLTGSGRIVGVAKAPADTTIFVTVTDANGCTLTQAYAARANEPLP